MMLKQFLLANTDMPGIAGIADTCKCVSYYPCPDAHKRMSRDVS